MDNCITWMKYLFGIPGTGRSLVRRWKSPIRHQTFCLSKLSLRDDLELASSSNYYQPDCIYVLTLILRGCLRYMNVLIFYRGLVPFMCKSAASEPKFYVPHKKGLLLPTPLPELQSSDGFRNPVSEETLSPAFWCLLHGSQNLHGETQPSLSHRLVKRIQQARKCESTLWPVGYDRHHDPNRDDSGENMVSCILFIVITCSKGFLTVPRHVVLYPGTFEKS